MPVIWSGGCSHHGDVQQAWNTYCVDRTDFNTANEHLTIGASSITILKAGFYRITFRTIGLGPAEGAIAMLRNGQIFHTGIKIRAPAAIGTGGKPTPM